VIRRAERSDLEAVERLLAENHLPTAGVRESLEHFIVATDASSVNGAIGLEVYDEPQGKTALLRSAVVDSSVRGSGLGTQLVQQIIELAAELQVQTLYLLTTTAEDYFPRFGFTRIGREAASEAVKSSVEFRGACPASAAVMVRPVTRADSAGQPPDSR
jgi:amino-acid N-acetyltransferase